MPNLLPGIHCTSAALDAERTRLDLIAQNVANAQTTRGANGQPYRRQQVAFETVLDEARTTAGGDYRLGGPRVTRIQSDPSPLRPLYSPGHPDANPATGIVQMPNVSIPEEMADMVAASRTFEANLAVLKTAKQMTLQAISIGKR
jgi:flagellar basal-body rod protein FlgC